ncbi:MAG: peptidylprolyl isomerase [Acidobacteria bacterium]|jgi:hypothetical protein|nr:peptidylprolyl isomerase [Acidobacteriota bacterium]
MKVGARAWPVVLGAAVAMLAAACGQKEPADVIAVVGHQRVKVETFQGYVEAVLGRSWESADSRLASRLLDQFLDQEVVAAAAGRKRPVRIPAAPEERSAAVRALLNELCGPPPEPPEAEVESAIKKASEVQRPARAHVRQILVESRDKALEAERRIAAGEDFVTVSREVSRAPNAEDGGELGTIAFGTLPEEFESVIFKLKPGQVSQPVKSPAGYHIFQLLERTPAGPPDRAEVTSEIKSRSAEQAGRRHLRQCIDRLAAEVGVQLVPGHLWFSYDGRYAEERHEDS